MNNSRIGIILGLCLSMFTVAPSMASEVFKCIDAAGKVNYTSTKDPKMKCTPVTAEITVVPAVKVPPPAPVKEQSGKEKQREALENKLKEQELALGRAKKDLSEQENLRLLTELHYQSKLDRIKPFQDKVAELEKAVALTRAELDQLK